MRVGRQGLSRHLIYQRLAQRVAFDVVRPEGVAGGVLAPHPSRRGHYKRRADGVAEDGHSEGIRKGEEGIRGGAEGIRQSLGQGHGYGDDRLNSRQNRTEGVL